MHKARAFFFVCAGLLCLALSYHLGARTAGAQQGSIVTGIVGGGTASDVSLHVMTANGDVFFRTLRLDPNSSPLTFFGNFWSGSGPTPAQRESFGSMKSRYRGERGAAQPAPQDR